MVLRRLVAIFYLFIHCSVAVADEGMWLPQLLQQLNAAEMRIKGLQIPIEEIYNVNKNSLKDAVVSFGGFCTGELISSKGLMITNHHCGFSQIQKQSTLEHNYLRDGFWAMSMKEEIPCPELTATFIIRIDDVTASFTNALEGLSEEQRAVKIKEIASGLEKKAMEGTHYEAAVKQLYSGNEFFLFVSETFRDVRLVGAPPSSIGNFGGDTDNWMWPRHTGDFSVFRIYADKDNKPAKFSPDNIPFTPRHHFSISMRGVEEEDFTMVYGFPGRTQQYISSYQLQTILEVNNPNGIKVRDERLRIMNEARRSSEALHLQYAAKHSRVNNAWKKWQGEIKGLTLSNGLKKKRDYEIDFSNWCNATEANKIKYGQVLPTLEKLYAQHLPYLSANDYYAEAVFGVEIISYANAYKKLIDATLEEKPDTAKVRIEATKLKSGVSDYFKDYDASTDKKMMSSLFKLFDEGVSDSLKPEYFTLLRNRYKSDFNKMAEKIFEDSKFDERAGMEKALSSFNTSKAKSLKKDPAYQLADQLLTFFRSKIQLKLVSFNIELQKWNRIYMAGQREMQPERKFYPDANSTLRLAYGKVKGYDARDAVFYEYQTNLDGVIQKYIPGHEEFDLPPRLIELHRNKDYGRYMVKGSVPVAFIATNHTTGGNSGSPVLNAKGQLIGTNYDRVWEGTMSDMLFNPDICRNVTLDIRYTLFIIDKFAGAKHLVDEMDIVE